MAIRRHALSRNQQVRPGTERAKAHLAELGTTGAAAQQKLQRIFTQFDGSKVIAEANTVIAAVKGIGAPPS